MTEQLTVGGLLDCMNRLRRYQTVVVPWSEVSPGSAIVWDQTPEQADWELDIARKLAKAGRYTLVQAGRTIFVNPDDEAKVLLMKEAEDA